MSAAHDSAVPSSEAWERLWNAGMLAAMALDAMGRFEYAADLRAALKTATPRAVAEARPRLAPNQWFGLALTTDQQPDISSVLWAPNVDPNWLVFIHREGGQLPTAVGVFDHEESARNFYNTHGSQWSGAYLCRVVLPKNGAVDGAGGETAELPEATARAWAEQSLRRLRDSAVEPHRYQQTADLVTCAIRDAWAHRNACTCAGVAGETCPTHKPMSPPPLTADVIDRIAARAVGLGAMSAAAVRSAITEVLGQTPPLTDERAREVACLADILDAWEAWPGEGEGYGEAAQEAMVAVHEALRKARYVTAFEVAPDGQALLSAARGELGAGERPASDYLRRAHHGCLDGDDADDARAYQGISARPMAEPTPATLTREEARERLLALGVRLVVIDDMIARPARYIDGSRESGKKARAILRAHVEWLDANGGAK